LPFQLAIGRIRASFLPVPYGDSSPVANIKSAEKRAKQTIKRRAANMATRSRMRTAIKNVYGAVEAGKKDEAAATLKAALPVIDAMVNKGIIHRNAAARYKSGLNARVKKLAAAK
jgi:small subunit ribosomal protein S20